MRLFEFEAKKMLSEYGISTPNGVVVSNGPTEEEWREPSFPVVVKAQLKAGGRGKAGAIKIAENSDALFREIEEMRQREFWGQRVECFLLEEFVAHNQEFYLSCAVARKSKKYALMLSPLGGVDIESHSHCVSIVEIDPLSGIMPHHLQDLMFQAGIDPLLKPVLAEAIRSVYRLFVQADAQIVEINPLVFVDSKCVALDAKVIVDDSSIPRHPELVEVRNGGTKGPVGSPSNNFAETIEKLGVNMQEQDGDIVILTGGAGRMMATLDLLADMGGTFRAFGELGVVVFQPQKMKESMKELIPAILALRPKVVFLSICWVLANCEDFAKALSVALDEVDLAGTPMVVRVCGNNQESAHRILSRYSDRIILETELLDACKVAVLLVEGGAVNVCNC